LGCKDGALLRAALKVVVVRVDSRVNDIRSHVLTTGVTSVGIGVAAALRELALVAYTCEPPRCIGLRLDI
jgi:hypothetical protein